jgi:hypothetical protein
MEKDALVGTWRLQEFCLTGGSGEVTRPWREGSTGLLMYTPDGYMSAAVTFVEILDNTPRYLAYCGPFEFDGDQVAHHIQVSSETGLNGTDQLRKVTFEPETLSLSSSPSLYGGDGTTATLVWRRVG